MEQHQHRAAVIREDTEAARAAEEVAEAEDDDLAPCAGTMVVALARAVLKHLSSRDGTNLCSEDLTLRTLSSSSPSADGDQLSIALEEVASPDHPLEARLLAGLSVLAKALAPRCFVALLDPQVLSCFRLGARALALCELMRQPAVQENGSTASAQRFTEEELAVVESTVRCYMCVALCALGGWERAQETSRDAIKDGDASPFQDANAAKMFKVLMACVAQFQALTTEAAARRSKDASGGSAGGAAMVAGVPSSARVPGTGRTAATHNSGSTASEIDSFTVLNSVISTLNHAKRWLGGGEHSTTQQLEHRMLHLTQVAVSAAVLTERAEAMVARVREQDAAAQHDQRRLFRKLRLSKDPAQAAAIQGAAQDLGSAQDTELRRSVLGLHRIACSLWRVIADCCNASVDFATAPAPVAAGGADSSKKPPRSRTPSPPPHSNNSKQQQRHTTTPITTGDGAVHAGCAITVAECLRGLMLIRTVPLVDARLLHVHDLNVPVARSVVAALGDASAWALHVRLTAILAMLRHGDLPAPSAVAAWSISPDVLTSSWRPPAALVARAREMVTEGGLATKPPPPSARKTTARTAAALRKAESGSESEDDKKGGDNDNEDARDKKRREERAVVVADFSSDVMEALMMLDEVAIQRERIVMLGLGIRGGKRHRREGSRSPSVFLPAQFDDCEYLGGASKVAALVSALDNIIASSTDDGDGAAPRLPQLADSTIIEARRLRRIISQKVPAAEAVALAAEQQRMRKTSPRSGRSSPTSAPSATTRGGGAGAGGAASNANNNAGKSRSPPPASGSGVRVVRRPTLAVNPSGGVLKNGDAIRFVLGEHFLAMADRGTVELLVSLAHGSGAAAAAEQRVFKAHDPRAPFAVSIGRHAPGWCEVHVILRDLSGTLKVKQRKPGAAAATSVSDEDEDGELDAFTKSVLCVTTARFYVVTHGGGSAVAANKKAKK